MAEFKPYVPAESQEPEFTLKAVLVGILLAAVFGAANAYLGMKAGQTVAATIPAAVIAIALFRLPFFRGGVLEQNLTRTAASVGEALVAGAIFTIPAFMMVNIRGQRLWTDLRTHFWVGTLILLAGGLLGCLAILPFNNFTAGLGNLVTFSHTAFQLHISAFSVLAGIAFALFIGVISGCLPARLAARSGLVEALRS